jgi:hypothetical protein
MLGSNLGLVTTVSIIFLYCLWMKDAVMEEEDKAKECLFHQCVIESEKPERRQSGFSFTTV